MSDCSYSQLVYLILTSLHEASLHCGCMKFPGLSERSTLFLAWLQAFVQSNHV